MQKVNCGDIIRTEPLNSLIREYEKRARETGVASAQRMAATIAIAHNDTGRDLQFGEAALLGELQISDYLEFLANPVLRLVAPEHDDNTARWVVAAEDIPAGAAGQVFESGVFPAKIKYANEHMGNWKFVEFVREIRNSAIYSDRNDWWTLLNGPVGSAVVLHFEGAGHDDPPWCWAIIRYGGYSYVPTLYRITYIDPNRQYVLAAPYIEGEEGSAAGEERRFDLPACTS